MHSAPSSSTASLQILSDVGTGRSFISVFDDERYTNLVNTMSQRISERARCVVVKTNQIGVENWRSAAKELAATLAQLSIRQTSFIGIGAGAALVQDLALTSPKSVRSLVVIDSPLRPHPTLWERMIDALECRLPFGLPLRLASKGFNVCSYAHRLRCPLLTVSTRRASAFLRSELQTLGQLAPTSWHVSLSESSEADEARELGSIVFAFQDTPAKCPQKNRQEAV